MTILKLFANAFRLACEDVKIYKMLLNIQYLVRGDSCAWLNSPAKWKNRRF